MSLRTKLVLIVDERMDRAQATNAAVVTGLSMGGRLPESVGDDGKDASGGVHAGLNPHPVPVLAAASSRLRELNDAARAREALTVVGFNDVARRSRDYDTYLADLARTPAEDIDYVAVAIFGPRSQVNALTKRLPLLK
ncbi:hypothetical protein GCM10009799_03350 [Nocardiopsis rhodophaea]|uniref:DUF2000 domain-containing protein n=1 Tax=Nocardiopsis rhodophaea TaxID=280238 RepID=A0ABN2S8H1_9ACTN